MNQAKIPEQAMLKLVEWLMESGSNHDDGSGGDFWALFYCDSDMQLRAELTADLKAFNDPLMEEDESETD